METRINSRDWMRGVFFKNNNAVSRLVSGLIGRIQFNFQKCLYTGDNNNGNKWSKKKERPLALLLLLFRWWNWLTRTYHDVEKKKKRWLHFHQLSSTFRLMVVSTWRRRRRRSRWDPHATDHSTTSGECWTVWKTADDRCTDCCCPPLRLVSFPYFYVGAQQRTATHSRQSRQRERRNDFKFWRHCHRLSFKFKYSLFFLFIII